MLLQSTLARYRPSYPGPHVQVDSPWKKFTDLRKRQQQHEIMTVSKCRLWARNSWSLGLWDSGMTDTFEDLREWLDRLWYDGILKLCHVLQVLEWDVQPLRKGAAAPTVRYGLPHGSEGGDAAAGGGTGGPGRSKIRSFSFTYFLCLFLDNHCSVNASHDSGYMKRSNIALSYI